MFKNTEESISILRSDVENVKKSSSVIRNTPEMKNALDGSNSRLDVTEAEISEPKDVTLETIPAETEKKKTKAKFFKA